MREHSYRRRATSRLVAVLVSMAISLSCPPTVTLATLVQGAQAKQMTAGAQESVDGLANYDMEESGVASLQGEDSSADMDKVEEIDEGNTEEPSDGAVDKNTSEELATSALDPAGLESIPVGKRMKGSPIAKASSGGTRQAFVDVVNGEPTGRPRGYEGENRNAYSYWAVGTDHSDSYYANSAPWCAMFVVWCAREASIDSSVIPTYWGCGNIHNWYASRGLFHSASSGYTPRAGDLVLYDWNNSDGPDHVGVVTRCADGIVYTKEGNVEGQYGDDTWEFSVSSSTNYYRWSHIFGYCSPDFGEPDFDFGPNVSLPAGDGTYTICSTLDRRLYLEVGGGSTEDGGNVQLWPGDGDEPQRRWTFTSNDDGTYTIWRYGTNKVLDVAEGSSDDCANIQIWESSGTDNQRWWLQDCGNGVYALKAKHSGKFLDTASGATADGTNVWQWHGHDRDGWGHSEKFFITPSYGPSVSLPQGGGDSGVIYNIAALSNPGVFVEVAGGGATDGDNVQLWEREDEPQRRWAFTRNDDGTYTIWRYGTNKVLDVYDKSLFAGANVQIWESSGDDNQRWWLEDCGDGVYALKAKHSGRFLDVSSGSAAKGVNLQQWHGNLTDAQRFIISPSFGCSVRLPEGDGLYEIVPVLSDEFVLGIDGESSENGSSLVLSSPDGDESQRFDFAMNSDGTYTITAAHSSKVLDVSGPSRASGAKVQQWAHNGNDNQRWWIEDLGGGEYAIKSKHSGKFLDVKGGVAQDCQPLWQYAGNGSASQRFRIVRWHTDLSEATLGEIAPQPVGAEPSLEVFYNGIVLTRGVDYELSWSGNSRPGVATVTVTGIGDFRGSVTAEFTVLDPDADGWVDLPGGRKGYAKNGSLVTGWIDRGGAKYYFQPDGSMSVGWTDVEVDGKVMHYYFNPASGNLVRGTWFQIDGSTYYFRPSGNMATGWATVDDSGAEKKYYLDEDGQLVTGWRDIEVDGKVLHYYFRPSGSMATGWATIDGEKYWFRPSGNMATGWADVDDAYKRYFDENGHMLTGWQEIGGRTYYFRPSGAMQTGTATIDGVEHTFSEKGVLVE